MKKYAALVMALLTLLSLTACGGSKEEPTTVPETTVAAVPPTTEAPTVPETTVPETTVPETTEATSVPETTRPSYVLDGKFRSVEETVYATRDVNIRTKPSVQSSSPGKLKKDKAVTRIGIALDGWSAVLIDDELRYIASEYLTTRAPGEKADLSQITEKEVNDVVYTTTEVNFRKGPAADADFLGRIPTGTKLERIAICSNGWCKVKFNGNTGYVAGNYVTEEDPAEATKPAETEPAETKPAETKPAETTPAESTPGESTEPDSPTTQPPQTDPPETETKDNEDQNPKN